MERSVAIKKLRKLLGKDFGYQINAKAPSPEEREAATAAMPAALAESTALRANLDARYKAILAADEEYQRLNAASREARKKVDELRGITLTNKITVGTMSSLFFHVTASGDTWEQVIEKVQQKQGAK